MTRAALLTLLGLAGLTLVVADAQGQEMSPHGSQDCIACHAGPTEGALANPVSFRGGHPDRTCLDCHEQDPHLVGMPPDRTRLPADFPLVDGKLSCASCHDEPACDGQQVSADNPLFFRGGPYQRIGELCARCHQSGDHLQYDPHAAMAADEPKVCEHCHLEVPDPADTRVVLRVDGPNICLSCHSESQHAGSLGHSGPLPESMLASAEQHQLPLNAKGEMVCLTCHDPHPAGVNHLSKGREQGLGQPLMPAAWSAQVLQPALEQRSPELGFSLQPVELEPDLLRLPLADGALCRACHQPASIDEEAP